MYKKILSSIIGIFCCTYLFADTPGKATMHDSKVSIQNIKKVQGYTFYYDYKYGDKQGTVNSDTSLIIPSSGGAPDYFTFWGINNTTHQSTDTITFRNYYAPDAVIILSDITNDSIRYTHIDLSNANEIVSEGNTDIIANKQLVEDAKAAKQSHYIQRGLLYFAGIAGLSGLIWFFIQRKKKKKVMSAQGTGS